MNISYDETKKNKNKKFNFTQEGLSQIMLYNYMIDNTHSFYYTATKFTNRLQVISMLKRNDI